MDELRPSASRDVFLWDSDMQGFGVRVKPSGTKTYIVQYRNDEGRIRRLIVGRHGVLTPEEARQLARQRLAAAARGEDPSAERHSARDGLTVADVCDWYLDQARSGRLLGRRRRAIKASTLVADASRIAVHIKPLIGSRMVRGLTLRDVEGMQSDILAGRTKRGVAGSAGRGGRAKGGAVVAARCVGTVRSLFGHAMRQGLIETNPAAGARQIASEPRKRRLSEQELALFGAALRQSEEDGEHPTGLAAIRLMLLTGFRRMEALGLRRDWVDRKRPCVDFPDTKGGAQARAISRHALAVIEAQGVQHGSPFVFPADWGDGHFIGVVRVLARVCARAELVDVTPHTLRHTFASVAGELNFSELTIRGLLGHSARGVTQSYIHLDRSLLLAADETAERIIALLKGEPTSDGREADDGRRARTDRLASPTRATQPSRRTDAAALHPVDGRRAGS